MHTPFSSDTLSFLVLFTKASGTTTLTHRPCSTTDDASQLSQFYQVQLTEVGYQAYYLGGTRDQSGNDQGYLYGGNEDSAPGVAYELIRDQGVTDPVDFTASFYLGG